MHQDITHTRSYCPSCNHRLSFLDLVPILSFCFLKGKCRYCKQKINSRYIIIEALSGVVYLIFVVSLKISFLSLEPQKLIYLFFGTLYFSMLYIIAGIEQQTGKISKQVLTFGIIFELIYITYLYIFNYNIYRYIIYFAVLLIIFLINLKKNNYTLDILTLCFLMAIFTGGIGTALTIFLAMLIILLQQLILKRKKKNVRIPISLYLGLLNFGILIIYNFII